MSEDRRCGTCGHWMKIAGPVIPTGECGAPIPRSVQGYEWDIEEMKESEGRDCPCWQPREGSK